MRGNPRDSPEIRVSKTLSWILRHGAQSEKIEMRPDGYVRVSDIVSFAIISSKFQGVDFETVENIVKNNDKQRYKMVKEPDPKSPTNEEVWWIRANQGHSIKTVAVDMKRITSAWDIPTGIAVHGTTLEAWSLIAQKGLSKMRRNHIHLAQGVPGSGVLSGMRRSSQILIYINVQKAIDAGIEFFLSENGVVLTPGNAKGYLEPSFFKKVERIEGKNRVPLPEWDSPDPEYDKLQEEAAVTVEGMTGGNPDALAVQPLQSEQAQEVVKSENSLVDQTEKLSI
ncbi:hypothetical protein GLOTRDRAFT_39589 [Gloeophyllum trabeum ATCC 11539]|uniref:2'-phosphotransferase n=1 Tax=Gloeophyllum trabeum (strain ATCC 11539 / FP-39264 / Madison 617) TaxID=670483 RepID=S7RQ84_GLOTA|nr:uncharacterized protein GLOTRDRAFT_39589 [Gloeophyllum trabeum ATCC 11539]EPQ56750.1 hypothetical protein GLOTRDRAFT_39589 [Gloeophyllum trabeum ATCC 11539]